MNKTYKSKIDGEYNFCEVRNGIIIKMSVGDVRAGCSCAFDRSTCVYKESCVKGFLKHLDESDVHEVEKAFSLTATLRKPVPIDVRFEWTDINTPPSDTRPVFVTIEYNGERRTVSDARYCRLQNGSGEWFLNSIPENFRKLETKVICWMDYPAPKSED